MELYQHENSGTVHLRKGCNGAENPVHLCLRCSDGLTQQKRIYRKLQNHSDTEFVPYDGRQRSPEPPFAEVTSQNQLKLHESARNLTDKKIRYVDVLISRDGTMVGLKPVSGADVTKQSLSANGGRISFEAVAKKLAVEFGYGKERFEVEWDTDEEMFVVDFSGKLV